MTARDSGQDAGDLIARGPGLLIPLTGRLSDEDFEKVREFTDPRANVTPDDYYAFRLIAASDGLDSYFTSQDPDTSLRNFGLDLKNGQSILGSHLTNTFSYGMSYDGEVSEADPSRREYEETFYRKHAGNEKFRAKHWTVGKYAIPRGITLNGQSTNDLIRGIELGAQRRVSISFTVGEYRCGIDNEDMISGFFGLEGKGKCSHFPGVDYGEDGLATAIMRDGDLHETSLVFKNSSPSAMFLRKAEELAQRGILPAAAVAQLEERLMVRLPRYVSPVYAGVGLPQMQVAEGTSNEERSMGDKTRHPDPEAEAQPVEGTETSAATEGNDDPEAAAAATALAGEGEQEAEAGQDEEGAAQAEDRSSAEGEHQEEAEAETEDTEDTEDTEAEASGDRAPATRAPGPDPALVTLKNRWAAITEAFGGEPTPDAIRQMVKDAKLGNDLFELEVDRAVKARVAVLGEGFDQPKYRAYLLATKDLEFVQSEVTSYTARTSAAFPVGRQVKPAAIPERPAGGAAPPRDPRGTSNPKGEGPNLVDALLTPRQSQKH